MEFVDKDWTEREWINVNKGKVAVFSVEKALVWVERKEKSEKSEVSFWPGLVCITVVNVL